MLRAVLDRASRVRWRRTLACCALCSGCVVAALSAVWALGWHAGNAELAALHAQRCDPLRVVDRVGRPLRTLPAACGVRAPRMHAWTALAEVSDTLVGLVLIGEDRRFQQHVGVDPWAVARAMLSNLRAGRIVSGASTLSMQLASRLHGQTHTRAVSAKLVQAWRGFALERRASKREILEAYLNVVYYGAGAYGIADAAATYFGKPVHALSDAEAALLAVLPRAPLAYDLRRHLPRALARRHYLLARLRAEHGITAGQAQAIEAEPLRILPLTAADALAAAPSKRALSASPATGGHFVDWLLPSVPERERRAGGTLTTTLDSTLQVALERAVREHVARHTADGVSQAGVVVLDTQTGAVRGMVGSSAYASSQLNIVTRRRELGSLLKPFVYALALEAGDSEDSIALDIGDAASEYRARDWVGREAGPLTYREALAGSYNLAAVHVLERVGVAALHERLRRAGVAQLTAAPARYGLPLALGSARVRLLDVVAGYGFMLRGGAVRRPYGFESLAHRDGSRFRPAATRDAVVFSSQVSLRTLALLSDTAARHRRFGRGLPLEELASGGQVAAKTGTASGMCDASAILASREFLVGAWSGRFDGAPTRGMSGMWGAGPLARRGLELALQGRTPTLPSVASDVPAADGGGEQAAAARAVPTRSTRTMRAIPVTEIEAWAGRARALGPRSPHTRR